MNEDAETLNGRPTTRTRGELYKRSHAAIISLPRLRAGAAPYIVQSSPAAAAVGVEVPRDRRRE
ncbi:hypothetical protein IMZ48_31495 [Candidatus Bathyarchaeota archaeon]|nr:hypothetical protein [Candidatus Bathyarchaeota archaeon]